MTSRETLTAHALAVIEAHGLAGFSTRLVCDRAGVTAPTLYHHFGTADGLISAAVLSGFEAFLARKVARPVANDPASDLMAGWDDYVAFARARPRLYAAMTARVLSGGTIPAADAAREHLVTKLRGLEADGRLSVAAGAAADLVWASAHAAALLHVSNPDPDPGAISALRQAAESVLAPDPP
jgi:AcrR family transcriptional regulator